MDRKDIILQSIDKQGLGVEIGPSHRPLAAKRDGFNVHIIDHMDRAGLVQKYRDHGVDLDAIEEVDFVWQGGSYADLIGKTDHYDWVLASHLIEHTTDFIGFLNDCAAILKDDGMLSLAVPDKRFCFDHFRPITPLAKIIDSHYQKPAVHTPGTVAEYFLNVVSKGGQIAWGQGHPGDFRFVHSLDEARSGMQAVIQHNAYLDVHAWCFVPSSFRLILHDLHNLGMTPLKEVAFHPTVGVEFFITLSKTGAGSPVSRETLLKQIDDEIMAGILDGRSPAPPSSPDAQPKAADARSAPMPESKADQIGVTSRLKRRLRSLLG